MIVIPFGLPDAELDKLNIHKKVTRLIDCHSNHPNSSNAVAIMQFDFKKSCTKEIYCRLEEIEAGAIYLYIPGIPSDVHLKFLALKKVTECFSEPFQCDIFMQRMTKRDKAARNLLIRNFKSFRESRCAESDQKEDFSMDHFSWREQQIMHLVLQGKYIKEISSITGLSKNKVDYSLKKIYATLGIKSKKDLVNHPMIRNYSFLNNL